MTIREDEQTPDLVLEYERGVEPLPSPSDSPPGTESVGDPGRRQIGEVLLSRYRIDALIGVGESSSVYRAFDLHRLAECTLKIATPSAPFVIGSRQPTALEREAATLGSLFHPNIIAAREYCCIEDGTEFLVLDHLEGEDLGARLAQAVPISSSQALAIIRALGSALQYLHDVNLVHCDLSPGSVFLCHRLGPDLPSGSDASSPPILTDSTSPPAEVKLLDLGRAASVPPRTTLVEQSQQSGIRSGNPAYLAPELTQGSPFLLSAAVDQWALAVLAYRLLGGRLPFDHPNPYHQMILIRQHTPLPLERLCPRLPIYTVRAIERAMSKQAEQRFPAVRDFLRALDNLPPVAEAAPAPVPPTRSVPARVLPLPLPTPARADLVAMAVAHQADGGAIPTPLPQELVSRLALATRAASSHSTGQLLSKRSPAHSSTASPTEAAGADSEITVRLPRLRSRLAIAAMVAAALVTALLLFLHQLTGRIRLFTVTLASGLLLSAWLASPAAAQVAKRIETLSPEPQPAPPWVFSPPIAVDSQPIPIGATQPRPQLLDAAIGSPILLRRKTPELWIGLGWGATLGFGGVVSGLVAFGQTHSFYASVHGAGLADGSQATGYAQADCLHILSGVLLATGGLVMTVTALSVLMSHRTRTLH